MSFTPKQIALKAAEILDNKKAGELKILDVADLTALADYFVICCGTSVPHVRALFEEVELKLKAEGVTPYHNEGYGDFSWVLMDYGSVLVHIFTKEAHDFYSLERLWTDAIPIELV